MKKYFILATVVALFAASCNKEAVESEKNYISLKANGEEVLDTKATLDNNLAIVWDASDKIGLIVSNSSNSWYTNQECTVSNGANTTDATFTSTTQYNDADKWNIAAFYPWNGEGSDVNNWYAGNNHEGNAYNGTMYFWLPQSYSNYTSGKSYLPMIANLSGSNTHPTEMHFKHVGAGVRVKVKNLPAGAKSIGMAVEGTQIYGGFNAFNPANAGTSALIGSGSASDNEIWLDFSPLTTSEDWIFIFPVPELNNPTLTFRVYDNNNVCIWSRKASSQPSVSRAHILEMPEITFSTPFNYYSRFKQQSANKIAGTFVDGGWDGNLAMVTDNEWDLAKSVTVPANAEFKVKINGTWDESYGSGSSNFKIGEAGTYDILFHRKDHIIIVIAAR